MQRSVPIHLYTLSLPCDMRMCGRVRDIDLQAGTNLRCEDGRHTGTVCRKRLSSRGKYLIVGVDGG